MKTVSNTIIVVGFVMFVGLFVSSKGQDLLSSRSRKEVRVNADEIHVHLEPQQELQTVELTEGCVTFVTEVRFSFTLPFDNSVEITLPPGSRWSIPAGKYKLDNPSNAPIEYVLRTGTTCREPLAKAGTIAADRVFLRPSTPRMPSRITTPSSLTFD